MSKDEVILFLVALVVAACGVLVGAYMWFVSHIGFVGTGL